MLKIKNKKKIGLVLSGGGVKAAAFHLGVCLALQEKGFKFIGGTQSKVDESPDVGDPLAIKTYVGSSAGAFVSALLASGHSLEDLIESFQMGVGLLRRPKKRSKLRPLKYFDIFAVNSHGFKGLLENVMRRPLPLARGGIEVALKNYLKVLGVFSVRGLEAYLRNHILPTNSFHELGVELFTIATELDRPQKVIFGQHSTGKNKRCKYVNHAPVSDAVAASLSLPPVFAPYCIPDPQGQDVFYFDGEIRETLSAHVAADVGADLVITSNSIQPYEYAPEVGSLSQFGIPIVINQALYQAVEQKISKAIEAREDVRTLIGIVTGYFKENNLPAEHAQKLVEIMSKRVNFSKDIEYIHITPKAQNYEMFFADHFSLNPEILDRITKIGFRSALNVLRKFDV